MSYLCTQTEDHSEDKIIASRWNTKMMQGTQNPHPPKKKWTDCRALHVNEHTDEAAQYFSKQLNNENHRKCFTCSNAGMKKPCFEYKNKHVLCFILIIIKI